MEMGTKIFAQYKVYNVKMFSMTPRQYLNVYLAVKTGTILCLLGNYFIPFIFYNHNSQSPINNKGIQ